MRARFNVPERSPLQEKSLHDAEKERVRAIFGSGQPGVMKKRSVVIDGHRTSVSLENAFWNALRLLALQKGLTVNQLVTQIDRDRDGNLSSAIRVYVLLSHFDDGDGTETTGLATQSLQ